MKRGAGHVQAHGMGSPGALHVRGAKPNQHNPFTLLQEAVTCQLDAPQSAPLLSQPMGKSMATGTAYQVQAYPSAPGHSDTRIPRARGQEWDTMSS